MRSGKDFKKLHFGSDQEKRPPYWVVFLWFFWKKMESITFILKQVSLLRLFFAYSLGGATD